MKSYFLLLISFISITTFSQNSISGKIINAENNEPLLYVNIGINNKTVGTVSNKNGLFTLSLNSKITQKDTVVFSYIGFKTKKYLLSELKTKNNIVLLHIENNELDQVIITSKKIVLKPKKIGRSVKGLGLMHANFYSYYEKGVDDRLSKEMGMKLKIKKNCQIKNLKFNITSNDFTSLKFRVNFYKIEGGIPTELLVHKNIIFEIKDNFIGWYTVDLENYKINLKKEIEESTTKKRAQNCALFYIEYVFKPIFIFLLLFLRHLLHSW